MAFLINSCSMLARCKKDCIGYDFDWFDVEPLYCKSNESKSKENSYL